MKTRILPLIITFIILFANSYSQDITQCIELVKASANVQKIKISRSASSDYEKQFSDIENKMKAVNVNNSSTTWALVEGVPLKNTNATSGNLSDDFKKEYTERIKSSSQMKETQDIEIYIPNPSIAEDCLKRMTQPGNIISGKPQVDDDLIMINQRLNTIEVAEIPIAEIITINAKRIDKSELKVKYAQSLFQFKLVDKKKDAIIYFRYRSSDNINRIVIPAVKDYSKFKLFEELKTVKVLSSATFDSAGVMINFTGFRQANGGYVYDLTITSEDGVYSSCFNDSQEIPNTEFKNYAIVTFKDNFYYSTKIHQAVDDSITLRTERIKSPPTKVNIMFCPPAE